MAATQRTPGQYRTGPRLKIETTYLPTSQGDGGARGWNERGETRRPLSTWVGRYSGPKHTDRLVPFLSTGRTVKTGGCETLPTTLILVLLETPGGKLQPR